METELDRGRRIADDFSQGVGGVCNDVFDALKEDHTREELAVLIERGIAKLAAWETCLASLPEDFLDEMHRDFDRSMERLAANVGKLRAKLASLP